MNNFWAIFFLNFQIPKTFFNRQYYAYLFRAIFKGYKKHDPVYAKNGPIVLLEDAIVNADSTVQPKNNWQDLYEAKDIEEGAAGF